jgi:hypothetical protein
MSKIAQISLLFLLIFSTIMVHAQNPVALGQNGLDEWVRNLQLLDKIDANQSLSNRPYYTNQAQSLNDLLHLVDSTNTYKLTKGNFKSHQWQILPLELTQKLNTTRPYGWNDHALGFSKGYQAQLRTGIYARWKILHAQYQPEIVHFAAGPFPKQTKILPGQSFLGIRAAGLSFGISSENLWWGPGRYSSLLMSNNARGFEHIRLNTTRPIYIGIGSIEFALVLGRMTRDTSQGFENSYLKKRVFDYKQPSTRQYNGLNIVFQPRFIKNVFFGVTRAFQNYEITKANASFSQNYLPVINGLFKNNYADDTLSKDQILSLYTRWLFPKSHAEVYFEYGYNDAKQNGRDLMLNMSHAGAYTFGFKKLHYLNTATFLALGAEATKMSQTTSYFQRSAGNWYEHGQVYEGFTNHNQIIGAGSGMGNDLQTITLSWHQGFKNIGIKFQHIANDPMLNTGENAAKLRNVKWDDYIFGLSGGYRYKQFIFSANVEYVKAKNYNWVNGNQQGNLFAFLNTIFIW